MIYLFLFYVLYFVVAMIFVGCFTVQWTWAFNTDPEGLMYLVSNPRGHEYELFCGMNINNCLIIIILFPGTSGRAVRKQKSRKRYIGVLHLSVFKGVYFWRNFTFLLFAMKTLETQTAGHFSRKNNVVLKI